MEPTNILRAIKNAVSNPIQALAEARTPLNRANGMGEALESYVKDLFCNTLEEQNIARKDEAYGHNFSYIGNQNNPPDIMIKGGDALEVKKHIGIRATDVALNSSYPKDMIYSDSPMITTECRECESWDKKDIIYAIGSIVESTIRSLWFVYGTCYAANRDKYERVRNKIAEGVSQLTDIEFGETAELARVNRVDPLGITYLRVRGMWGIQHPARVFAGLEGTAQDGSLNINALMLSSKYDSFSEADRTALEDIQSDSFKISDVKIKSPNNPAHMLDAKLIAYKLL